MNSLGTSNKNITTRMVIEAEHRKFIVIDDSLAKAIGIEIGDFLEESIVENGILLRKQTDSRRGIK